MWSEYVTSSASTRISPGSTRLIPRYEVSRSTARAAGRAAAARAYQAAQNGQRAADEVLPRAALRLAQSERRRSRTSGDRPSAGSTPWRSARGPPRAWPPRAREVRRPVARRHPDVRARERGREGVDGRVEPPRALLEAERPAGPARGTRCCVSIGKSPSRNESSAGSPASRTIAVSSGREHVEDRSHLGRLHPRLVLVEQRVVGRVTRLEVLGPAERDVRARAEAPGGRRRSRSPRAPRPRRLVPSRPRVPRHSSSSAGTRPAFSQSRRVTRIRLASSESWPSSSSSGATSSSSRPISSEMKRSWTSPESVAAASDRAAAPFGGIIVR